MKRISISAALMIVACTAQEAPVPLADHTATVEQSRALVPSPPWPAGDERGMGNTLGRGTWLRCAYHLADPRAKLYELSHKRSATAPVSPFGVPLEYTFRPTAGVPYTRHAFNGESICGEPAAQITQMDALGHFGVLSEIWDGSGSLPTEHITYYRGYSQAEVKPTPDSPLLKLGIAEQHIGNF